ncbi:type II toxin-antitoxin system RelE/ParE family toxin, partial [Thermococci archaeon]
YRLRVGNHRFLYVIKENDLLIEEAFRREKGY